VDARAAGALGLSERVQLLARIGGNAESARAQTDTLAATLGAEDGRFRQVENAVLAQDLLSELTARERQILRLRFEQDLTQSEIGELVGCSQMHVSRIIRTSLEKLHAFGSGLRVD